MMKPFDRKINSIILTIYLFLCVFAFIYVFVTDSAIPLILISAVLLAGLWFVSNIILRQISKMKIEAEASCPDPGMVIRWGIISSVLAFSVLMVWFIGYRPGSFQGDCINQFGQALSGRYDDWHPVWQTILFYTIPLKLTAGSTWAPTLFQMIWFSLTAGYLTAVIYKHAGKWWAMGIFAYIMLNPYTGQMLLYPWKDCAFAIAGTLAMTMAAQIFFSDGRWADKKYRCILLGFMLANCTIFRHNAVLLTGVLLIALYFRMPDEDAKDGSRSGLLRKNWLIVTVSFIITIAVIKIPLYNALNVTRTPQSVVQSVGLPMAVIGNVTKETPELLDEETADLVYAIAPQSGWDTCYELGNFGVMKYYGDVDLTPIEEAGTGRIVKMAFKCIAASPKASFKAIFALTDIVYGLDIKDEGYIGSQIIDNSLGIEYNGNERLAGLLMTYYKLIRLHGLNFTRQFAFVLLVLLIVILAKCDLTKRSDLKKILICLGIYTYSFGTMLLLTSADSRFFYIDYLICPIGLIMVLKNDQIKDKNVLSESVKTDGK